MSRLFHLWHSMRTSYWFVPCLMSAGAVALAIVLLQWELKSATLDGTPFIYVSSASGARAVLSTIAGSMITVAGVTFSITIVALTLASSQFGPRVLRNFMRDTGNQVVLGAFIATFIYCIVVLGTVTDDEHGDNVPHLAVTGAIALGLFSSGVLIYFIHHISSTIQIERVVARVASELSGVVDELYPASIGQDAEGRSVDPASVLPEDFVDRSVVVRAPISGYLQLVDGPRLIEATEQHDLIVRIEVLPGEYRSAGDCLARAWPSERVSEEAKHALQRSFTLGSVRTPEQDAGFPLTQLVEIAVRALSPGVNEPFSAMLCLDRLTTGLLRVASRRGMPSPVRLGRNGRVRIVTAPITLHHMIAQVFDPLRNYAMSDLMMTLRMVESLTMLAGATTDEKARDALRHQAQAIAEEWQQKKRDSRDRQLVLEAVQHALVALQTPHANAEQAPAGS